MQKTCQFSVQIEMPLEKNPKICCTNGKSDPNHQKSFGKSATDFYPVDP
jgi:hypothetical protein